MKKIRYVLLFIILFIPSINLCAQIGITSYSFDVISFNAPVIRFDEAKITGELKTFGNTDLENLSFELDLLYQFKAREYHKFSFGAGLKSDPFTDGGDGTKILIPVSLEIFPWSEMNKVSFVIELASEFSVDDTYRLRSLLGLRYVFGKE